MHLFALQQVCEEFNYDASGSLYNLRILGTRLYIRMHLQCMVNFCHLT